MNLKNKDKDSASEPTTVNAVMPGGTNKKLKPSNKGKKGGRGASRGGNNSGQAHENIQSQPQPNQAYGQQRGGFNSGYYNQGYYNPRSNYNPQNQMQQPYQAQPQYQGPYRGNSNRGYQRGGSSMRGRGGGYGGPANPSNGASRFSGCFRCEGSLDSVHGTGHWKGDCTAPLKCRICSGPHYTGKCTQFDKEQHQHLLYQSASIVEVPPDNPNFWISHETGNMNWGWGLQGGDDQGTVQNNAVSVSGASVSSDTYRSTGGGMEW